MNLAAVFVVSFHFLTALSPTKSDASSGYKSDAGELLINGLRQAIDTAESQLVNDTLYSDYTPLDGDIFDFIVVGAGSAGAVVANRLSENPSWRVLLIEAGGDPTPSTEIPALLGAALGSSLDWQYQTEPEKTNCLGSVNGRCLWPRGKVLGGSSAINAMLYVRGNPNDYDSWEEMGNKGWGYKQMLPYFKKSEDMRSEDVMNTSCFPICHGTRGLLTVESFQYDMEHFEILLSNGFKHLGYQKYKDVNGPYKEGFFTLQGTLRNARRCSTAKAFLHDFQTRTNLKISKNSLVMNILTQDRIAYGVTFKKQGVELTVRASKEVVLSAGAINTPQLLMLSGIGPRDHLEYLGIPVIKDLRVGFNLQDHPLFRGFLVTLDIKNPQINATEAIFDFLIRSKGYFSGVGLFSNAGFIRTSSELYPNIQFFFTSYSANSSQVTQQSLTTLGFNKVVQQSIIKIASTKFVLLVMPSVLRPKSRGRILLANKNPSSHPLITSGYFSNDKDVQELLKAIDFANRLVRTPPFRALGAQVQHIDLPGCRRLQFQSEDYWRCLIRHLSTSVYHPVGTCKMGPASSANSVVDSDLSVIGVKNLRVVDASIMPTITRGNTNAPTIAIAEKASDLIKQRWS